MHEQMCLEVTKELLKHPRTDLEDPDATPLMLAAFQGWEDQVRIILKRGVNINTVNHSGVSALMQAILMSHTPVVKLLSAQEEILLDQFG
ncbi:hypothetical protein BDV59DRAFT_164093 [Aspergillus ambiguus]|uniref:ankyrin repeat domain-containing protein n=1 Tax=Aspergillus ambiguus TaxID=176160 RepID=UPI003CCD3166